MITWINGSKLTGVAKADAIARFVHRFTGDHTPRWAFALKIIAEDAAKTTDAAPFPFPGKRLSAHSA